MNKEKSKSILELSDKEAREFFLRSESYSTIKLPPYFTFDQIIKDTSEICESGEIFEDGRKKIRRCEGVNYTILSNKDGKYAWRPLSLIHPALYISLVNVITKNWLHIINQFKTFPGNEESDSKKILCLGLPVVPLSEGEATSEQIFHWWNKIEQHSIALSLEYDQLFQFDIKSCYESIYTHSIAWALHGKKQAKENRGCKELIGNQIDIHIQDMCQGQTNGIPQGSTLTDFIAEMVLGYIDIQISKEINDKGIEDYKILRYRDDYRVFVNSQRDGENIGKIIAGELLSMGLQVNESKTKVDKDVIQASIKSDKLAWLNKEWLRGKGNITFQKHLLIIHSYALNYPNSGGLIKALEEYLFRLKEKLENSNKIQEIAEPLISIVVDIACNNPRVYGICSAILSFLLDLVDDKKTISNKIKERFTKIPNAEIMEIWLQRLFVPYRNDFTINYSTSLCKLVSGEDIKIWNTKWCDKLDRALDARKIIDKEKLINISHRMEEFNTSKLPYW